MIFRFFITAGFSLLILLTEVITDISENDLDVTAFFYNRRLENEALCKDMEDKGCQPGSNATSSNDEKENYVTLLPDDQNHCDIKEPIPCDPLYPYRSINGSCNNLDHPTWGISRGCYLRLQPAFYHGYEKMLKSVTGNPLPLPREISLNIFKDVHRHSSKLSLMFTIYGQTVAHDLSRAEIGTLDVDCSTPTSFTHPGCASTPVRSDDPFYAKYNQTCIVMHRTDKCKDCSATTRQQVNGATAPLDISTVYGSNDKKAMLIRASDGTGKLLSNLTENGELFTSDFHAHKLFCPLQKNCFLTGDVRVNQHVFLSSMETLFMREHNRVATNLKKLNPHWEEEKLYQESRRIVIATLQCITYKEYLPKLLGPYAMKKFDLTLRNGSEGTKYNPNIRIGVRNEFASAAFRLHSMIPHEVGSFGLTFKDVFQNPKLIMEGHMEKILKGASNVPSEKYDRYCVHDITNHNPLYDKGFFGIDLITVDLQRSRDHGLPPYIVMVNYCSQGQVDIKSFDDLAPLLMSKKRADVLKENYESIEDIDLYVGLHFERKFPGSELGPTALCIVTQQFYFSKFADRFYFEHEGEVPSFTKDQRNSLKQCSLPRLLCDNSNITHVQKSPMLLPDNINHEVSCEDVPKIDLNYWKEST